MITFCPAIGLRSEGGILWNIVRILPEIPGRECQSFDCQAYWDNATPPLLS
jgi:hypothetical protein